MTHVCASKLTIIGSDNGLLPDRRQAIIWTNAGISLIGPARTNFNEILIEILYIFIKEYAFETVVCEMAAILSRPQCVKKAHLIHVAWPRGRIMWCLLWVRSLIFASRQWTHCCPVDTWRKITLLLRRNDVVASSCVRWMNSISCNVGSRYIYLKRKKAPRTVTTRLQLHGDNSVSIVTFLIHHDDVIKMKHFSRYWPFVLGTHRSPVNSPHKGQWRGAVNVFFGLRLNKPLSKLSWSWWFETPSRSWWLHRNEFLLPSRSWLWFWPSYFAVRSWRMTIRNCKSHSNDMGWMNPLSHTVWTSLFEHFRTSKPNIDIVATPTRLSHIQKRFSVLQICSYMLKYWKSVV